MKYLVALFFISMLVLAAFADDGSQENAATPSSAVGSGSDSDQSETEEIILIESSGTDSIEDRRKRDINMLADDEEEVELITVIIGQ